MGITCIHFPERDESFQYWFRFHAHRVRVSEWLIIFIPLFNSIKFDTKTTWPPWETKSLLLLAFSKTQLFSEWPTKVPLRQRTGSLMMLSAHWSFWPDLRNRYPSCHGVDTLPSMQHSQSLPQWVNCNFPHFTALILASVGTSTSRSPLISGAAMWIDH